MTNTTSPETNTHNHNHRRRRNLGRRNHNKMSQLANTRTVVLLCYVCIASQLASPYGLGIHAGTITPSAPHQTPPSMNALSSSSSSSSPAATSSLFSTRPGLSNSGSGGGTSSGDNPRTKTLRELFAKPDEGTVPFRRLGAKGTMKDIWNKCRGRSEASRSYTPLSSTSSSSSSSSFPPPPPPPPLEPSRLKSEYESSLFSRLLYTYVSPLLKISSQRQLESSDAFRVPDEKTMSAAVPELERIYHRCHFKAQKHLEQMKASTSSSSSTNGNTSSTTNSDNRQQAKSLHLKRKLNQKIAKSESLLLAKALFLHQKKNIAITGFLRLGNTIVQAFPAILVSRLLRLIESSSTSTSPQSDVTLQAMGAAVMLVTVLSLKMILENQYFHGVVKCATQIRGSLSGIIFDKSLRLPSASASVMDYNGRFAVSDGDGGERDGNSDSNDNANGNSTNNSSSSRDEKKSNRKGGVSDTKRATASLGTGGVLNLMQSDASIIEIAAMQVHTLWDGLLQIAIYTTLLFKYLGPSVLWGISVLILTIPTNGVTLRVLNRLSRYENEAKDARTKRTAEAISNMKLLKLQAWEGNFQEGIELSRKEELRRHINRGAFRALNQAISNAIPAIVLVVTLTAYKRTGRPIVASTIFTAISLFNQLRFPLFFYPMLIDSFANGRNALRRISAYLSQEELTPYVQKLPKDEALGEGGSIEMKNGNFLWSAAASSFGDDASETSMGAPALCGADLRVRPGEVVAVVGPVGSGKTALIKALLGELAPAPRIAVDNSLGNSATSTSTSQSFTNGSTNDPGIMDVPTVISKGSIAYCAQESWLAKGTIRETIVFGREYNEARYLSCLCDAGLDADIVDGDGKDAAARGMLSHDTDVGEGGSSLSGGQRARVQLARALYEDDAGVYLLDDPLSALDASVGSLVFERVTRRLRNRKAATVFVTNDPSLPRRCDRVILMGKLDQSFPGSQSCSGIIDVGTYDDLVARGHDLRSLSMDESKKRSTSSQTFGTKQPVLEVSGTSSDMIETVDKLDQGRNHTIETRHADPDSRVSMEHDPEYLAEHLVPVPPAIDPDLEDLDKCQITIETRGVEHDVTSKTSQTDQPKSSNSNKLVSIDDTMTTGAVPRSTYISYFKSVRKPFWIVAALMSYLMSNGAQFFQQYTVAKWTEIGSGDAMAAALGGKYLRSLVYAAGVVSIFLWLRSFILMRVGTRASEFLHSRLLSSVFNAPVSFFDATPSGQLLSRFGKEMETVDRAVPDGIGSVLFCFLQIFMSVAALAGVVTPAMLIPFGLIGTQYASTMARFRPAARDLKRCESKSRSPIYTHFGEALRGTETIRSFPSSAFSWSSQHRHLTDDNLSVFYSVKSLDRWLSIRLETLGNVAVLTAALASVILTRAGRLKPGSAGWGLTQALSITGLLTWAVRVLTDLETQMMSVLRVTELIDVDSTNGENQLTQTSRNQKMPREYAKPGQAFQAIYSSEENSFLAFSPSSDDSLVEAGWPFQGGISFKNVSMRYNSVSPLVLKNVTIDIPPGTTLGVVGRTGSGKSSLLLTLFRLIEVEKGGSIEIDGIDIRSVNLKTLRESLSIIPQDPVLFAGTVMYNLDATGKSSKEDAWEALEAASPDLANQFRTSGYGLDALITEGGKNLSLGQRQLICLARALLRKSKILVLDEATSSVDSKTDGEVQDTIRREFVNKGVSVITVAHRLDTVLGYDKIAVLGDGELIEYGVPDDLLKLPGGNLRKLVDAYERSKKKGAITKQPSLAGVT